LLGAFGEVRFCTHKKTGAKRAVKIIKKSYLKGKEEERFLSEIDILKHMVISTSSKSFIFYLNLIQLTQLIKIAFSFIFKLSV